jgi:hypothetical protein
MKNTFLLLLCTTFLNAFGQNVRPTAGHSHIEKYAANNHQNVVEAIKSISPIEPQSLSNRLSSLVSLTGVQIIDSIYTWQWDSVFQEWVVDFRIIDIIYNSGFLPETYTTQYKNGDSWTNESRYTLLFNANNQITQETYEEWDDHEWEFSFKALNTYDDQQNLTSETFHEWGGDFWKISGRKLYTYDTANHLLSLLFQNLDIDVYENETQNLYTYDKEGNQIHELDQFWFADQWIDNFQIFNTFDHLSNQLFDLVQTFDGTEWVNYRQSGFQYDTQNNRTYHLQQYWNGIEWENEYQYYYTFDPANNPATDEEQTWNGTDWGTYLTISYAHDADNFLESEVYSYFQNGETLASYADSTYYYYHSVTGLADVSPSLNEMIISPNPTSGLFAIDHKDEIVAVDVYNITGARIAHLEPAQHANHLDLDISGNNPGMYILQIRTASAVYGAKVLLH